MRLSTLPVLAAVAAFALFAPAAGARPIDQPAAVPAQQDLRSPDARDAVAAAHGQTPQDRNAPDPTTAAALAQERYYASYGPATTSRHTAQAPDDGSPLLTLVSGIGLTLVVAGSVAFAVRTHRRAARVRVTA